MQKSGKKVVADHAETQSSTKFAHGAKQIYSSPEVKNNYVFQWDDEGKCSGNVTVISKSGDACFAAKQMSDDPVKFEHYIRSLTATQLAAKYRGEYNSHRNMKARIKAKGSKAHPKFETFVDFLSYMGPKPTKNATVDRIDNNDPEYAPGKVQWADKQTQNRNKGDSLIFTCATSNRSYTAGQLAKRQSMTPAAIRSRRARGWTDAEIIAGQRVKEPPQTMKSQIAITMPIRQMDKSTSQILFERHREIIEHTRREDGVEPFIATPKELQEILQDDFPYMKGKEWLRRAEMSFEKRKLPEYWRNYGPHINFSALRPDQQAWVLRVDPSQRQV